MKDIPDGTSQTLMVGERSRNLADVTWIGAVPKQMILSRVQKHIS